MDDISDVPQAYIISPTRLFRLDSDLPTTRGFDIVFIGFGLCYLDTLLQIRRGSTTQTTRGDSTKLHAVRARCLLSALGHHREYRKVTHHTVIIHSLEYPFLE